MMTFNSVTDAVWAIVYICDVVTIGNIFVCFFVVFIDDQGIAYAKSGIIARQYVRGLFFVDVLSVLPFDYFMIGAMQVLIYNRWLRATLRLNRFLGLIRVFRFISEFRSCVL